MKAPKAAWSQARFIDTLPANARYGVHYTTAPRAGITCPKATTGSVRKCVVPRDGGQAAKGGILPRETVGCREAGPLPGIVYANSTRRSRERP